MTNFKQALINKINRKKAKVAVIGLGYVGLPLAIEFAKQGFAIYGIDTDREKIKKEYEQIRREYGAKGPRQF